MEYSPVNLDRLNVFPANAQVDPEMMAAAGVIKSPKKPVKILGGFGNIDEGEINLPGDAYTGVSLRTWDPDKSRWSIYWLDSRRPGYLFPPVHGGFDKGVGTFYGDDAFKGRPIRVRNVWSRIAESSARWEQAFSLDEGNNWETNWYMDFTRV